MNLDEFNLSGLTHPELAELKTKIEARMEEMRVAGVAALRERLIEDAAALGVTIDEVVVSTKGRRGRPRKPRNEGEEVKAAV
jgi:hypothetical protein